MLHKRFFVKTLIVITFYARAIFAETFLGATFWIVPQMSSLTAAITGSLFVLGFLVLLALHLNPRVRLLDFMLIYKYL